MTSYLERAAARGTCLYDECSRCYECDPKCPCQGGRWCYRCKTWHAVMETVLGQWARTSVELSPGRAHDESRQAVIRFAEGKVHESRRDQLAFLMEWTWQAVLPGLQEVADHLGCGREWRTMLREQSDRSIRAVYYHLNQWQSQQADERATEEGRAATYLAYVLQDFDRARSDDDAAPVNIARAAGAAGACLGQYQAISTTGNVIPILVAAHEATWVEFWSGLDEKWEKYLGGQR